MTPFSILLVLSSALLHSLWNYLTKKGNSSIEFFFWVFLWGVLLYIPFFIIFGSFSSILLQSSPKLWRLVIPSGFFETVYFICLIEAYRGGDLSLIYPISRSAPLFTLIWAISFIGESLSNRGIMGIGFVMVGLFVVSLKNFRPLHMVSTSRRFTSRPYLLALSAAVASSVYSVIDKVGVQIMHPVFYIWLINLWMLLFTGLYLAFRNKISLLTVWQGSRKEVFIITILLNGAYLLILMALQMSKVSYVVAFRQVSTLFGAGMGIVLLKESSWKTRMTGAIILVFGLILLGLAD